MSRTPHGHPAVVVGTVDSFLSCVSPSLIAVAASCRARCDIADICFPKM